MSNVTNNNKNLISGDAAKQSNTTFLSKVIVFCISLTIVLLTLLFVYAYINNQFIKPADASDPNEYEVEIKSGSSLNTIADTLYEKGIIRNSTVFKLFVDLSDNTSKLKSGKHLFKKSMTLQEIMDELLTGKTAVAEVTITIREDWDIERLADYLVNDKGFDFTQTQFIEAASVDNFPEFPFLMDIPEERKNGEIGVSGLEGYLFPETYRVYENAVPEDILRKLLNQFEIEYNEIFTARADEMGMTTDQVIILASVIQKEARLEDEFDKISAVFQNRLNTEMALESCATVQFLINENRWTLTEEEMKIDSPYNTYLYSGLPAGPICSPGSLAIRATLYPYEAYMGKPPYLFFVLKDPDTGEHAFNFDYNSHLRDKAKYEEKWKEIEAQQ